MDAAEGHLVAAVAVGKILPILGLQRLRPAPLGNGHVLLVQDVGWVGKGPEQLGLGQLGQGPLDHPVVGCHLCHGRFGGRGKAGVDLHLVFAEIPDDVALGGEGVGRVRKIA